MINTIILEENPTGLHLLQNYLAENCTNVQVIETVHTLDACYRAITRHKPDIVFFDGDLEDGSSFEMLDWFDKIEFEVIITTQSEAYALKALKYNVLDYLLKPYDVGELKTAIAKVEAKKSKHSFERHIDTLFQNVTMGNNNTKIAISTSEGLVFKKVKDILYLESDGAYTHFIMKDEENIMTSYNIKIYEAILSQHCFFRAHRSHIINLLEVDRYVRGEGGHVIMTNKKLLDVSKRKKDEFYEALESIGMMNRGKQTKEEPAITVAAIA